MCILGLGHVFLQVMTFFYLSLIFFCLCCSEELDGDGRESLVKDFVPTPLCLEGPAGEAAVSPPTAVDCDNFVVSMQQEVVQVNFVEASVAPVGCDNFVVPMQQEEVTVNFVEACVAPVDEVKVEVEQSVVAQSENDPVIPSEIFYFFAEHYYTKATRRIAPDCNAFIDFLLCFFLRFLLFVLFVLEVSMCLSKFLVLQFVGDFGPRTVLWLHRTGEALPLTFSSSLPLTKTGIGGCVFSSPDFRQPEGGGDVMRSPHSQALGPPNMGRLQTANPDSVNQQSI